MGCQYDNGEQRLEGYRVQDLPLNTFVGPDGLVQLLAFLHERRLPQEEVLEMIKRVHVPGYEQARFLFGEAISEGAFSRRSAAGYHTQEEIKATLQYEEERWRERDN